MASYIASDRLSITIPNGSNVSNPIDGKAIGDAAAIHIYAPAALDAATTYLIEVSSDYNRDGFNTEAAAVAAATWQTWQLGDTAPADIAPPVAGKARTYFELPGVGAFRFKGSGNSTADRTWKMTRLVLVTT